MNYLDEGGWRRGSLYGTSVCLSQKTEVISMEHSPTAPLTSFILFTRIIQMDTRLLVLLLTEIIQDLMDCLVGIWR